MIARLHGTIVSLDQDSLVIDVGGVGYRVRVPRSLLAEIAGTGQMMTLHTHLHVRENELTLYGCANEAQLELFKSLLGVSGIGPRSAMNIISSLDPQTLREAIAHGDVAALARLQGIGRRTAERLVNELRDKMGEASGGPAAGLSAGDAEVIAALTALGYSVVEAQRALSGLPAAGSIPLEERIRLALQSFVRE